MPNLPKTKQRPWIPRRKAFERKKYDNKGFYQSHAWRKTAKTHKIKNPLCVLCEKEGITTAVRVTDHIVPIRLGGDPFNEDNLQSLCEMHHNQKSGEESHIS